MLLKKKIYDIQHTFDNLTAAEGRIFPVMNLPSINPKSNDCLNTRFNKNTLILLYTHFDCGSCVNTTIQTLSKFNKKHNQKINIFGIANTEKPIEIWKRTRAIASFPVYQDLNDSTSIFNRFKNTAFPLLLFILGNNNRIIYAKKATNNSEEMNSYIKRFENWIE